MKRFFISITTAVSLSMAASMALAVPTSMITHNFTRFDSNAYIGGEIPSPAPSKPNATTVVSWLVVQMACFGRTVNDSCPATIKMATTTANPVVVGNVAMNIRSGEITPKTLAANGFTLTVNGPGEATITEDKPH